MMDGQCGNIRTTNRAKPTLKNNITAILHNTYTYVFFLSEKLKKKTKSDNTATQGSKI
jgi:predicted transcriptional regulator with HTH domain